MHEVLAHVREISLAVLGKKHYYVLVPGFVDYDAECYW